MLEVVGKVVGWGYGPVRLVAGWLFAWLVCFCDVTVVWYS